MPLGRRVARFNRLFANYFAGPVLTRMPGFGTVHHRGRKSGREYSTPVKLFRDGEGYIITLPYGPGSDWVKNVLAAGGCDLVTRGRSIKLDHPLILPFDANAKVPGWARFVMSRIMRSPEFLRLAVAHEPARVPVRPPEYQDS